MENLLLVKLNTNNLVYVAGTSIPYQWGLADFVKLFAGEVRDGDYEPIPLDAKWLKKIGVKSHEENWFYINASKNQVRPLKINVRLNPEDNEDGRYYISLWDESEEVVIYEGDKYFVHDFQNLYFNLMQEYLVVDAGKAMIMDNMDVLCFISDDKQGNIDKQKHPLFYGWLFNNIDMIAAHNKDGQVAWYCFADGYERLKAELGVSGEFFKVGFADVSITLFVIESFVSRRQDFEVTSKFSSPSRRRRIKELQAL